MAKTGESVLKALVMFWVVCAVLCEHNKRDVHHRIILKQRVPRSQNKGHSHTRGHDYKRGRHNYSRGNGHEHKKPKKQHSYERDSSEEDSYSRENSFEEIFRKHKDHKSIYNDSKKSHNSPSYYVKEDYDETRQFPYKEDTKYVFPNEWIPLSSEQLYRHSRESFRDKNKKKRDSRRNYLTSLKPPPVDLTTSYPFLLDISTIYPPLNNYPNTFYNFDLNKKNIESNQSPLIGTIEQPNFQFSDIKENFDKLKNHRTSYEVTELTPSDSNTNTFISVPDDTDDSPSESIAEEVTTKISKPQKEVKSTQRPTRTRGRSTYRTQKNP